MEPRPGIEGNAARAGARGEVVSASRKDGSGLLDALGRQLGFLMFALPAMAMLAAVILLPAWKGCQDTQYELACRQAEAARTKEALDANQRLIKILQEDPNVTIRLAMSQGPVEPANEIFIKDPANPPRLPMMTMPKRTQRPQPPGGPLVEAAALVSNTKVQRGLLLLTISAVLGGVLMFWPKKN